MNKISLNEIEKPEEAFQRINEYLAEFKQKQVIRPAISGDEFYTSYHRISRLFQNSGDATDNYIYDKTTYCRGCDVNCGRVYNQIELRSLNKDNVKKFLETCVEIPHELTRNLAVGLNFGHEDLEIRTWHENYPKKIRLGRIRIFEGFVIRDLDSGYEQTINTIEKIRSGVK